MRVGMCFVVFLFFMFVCRKMLVLWLSRVSWTRDGVCEERCQGENGVSFVFLLFCVLNSRIFLFCGIFRVFCQILFFCDGKRSIHISRQRDANFVQNSLIFFIIHFHFPLLPLLAAFLRVHGCPAPQSAS